MKWDNATGNLEVFSSPHPNPSPNFGRGERGEGNWITHHPPAGFERNVMFVEEMKHFIAVVQKKEQPVCTLEDGKRALQMALAALESARTGKLIKL